MKISYNPITAEALATAPANNDITFDLSGLNIFVRGVKFKGTDTTYSVFKKHTSSSGGGYNGLVPVPSYTSTNTRFLREDGTWLTITVSSYNYSQLIDENLNDYKTEGRWYYMPGSNTVTNGPTGINNGGEIYVGRNASGYRYLKAILLNGQIWFRIWNASTWSSWTRWYTDANTDSKVLLSASTTTNFRPIILGFNSSSSPSTLNTSVTDLVHTTTTIYALPSTGSLWANKLYSGGKPVLVEHLSLSNYVTINTNQTITGAKIFSTLLTANRIKITNTGAVKHIEFSRGNLNYITAPTSGSIAFVVEGQAPSSATSELIISNNKLYPGTTNVTYLGQSSLRWSNVYSVLGNFSGTVTSNGFNKNGSSNSYVLLGGGGHKALSDFALSTSLNNYVTINTALTITGVKTFSTLLKFTVALGTSPFTVTSNTVVTNLNADLLDGVHNGSITAAYTHNGAIRANRHISKNDNSGRPTYFIIADCTDTVNASSNGKHYGFTGIIIEKRTSGYAHEFITRITARVGYSISVRYLKSDSRTIIPCILKNGSNYYLALKSVGSGHDLYLYGYEINLLSTFTQINTTDSSGTLPDGYSIAYSGSGMDFYGNISSATKLQTTRYIWGLPFDGTLNISGNMSSVGNISMSGNITGVDRITTSAGDSGRYTFITNAGGFNFAVARGGWASGLVYYQTDGSTIIGYSAGAYGNGNTLSYYYYGGTYSSPKMVILSSGNVGIGTTSPSYKLHVVGNTYVSGSFTAGSYIYSQNGWFQNNKSGCGLYNSAHDARWYANSNGWYADKAATFAGYITSAGFKKSGSSDSYVLLGGGGHKLLSELSLVGHTHSYLPYQDTRSTNYAPYASNFSAKGLSATHLKYNTTDGLNDGGTYHTSIYIHPWGDSSGGAAHNLAFTDNGNMWVRSGASSWGSWKIILNSSNYTSYVKKIGTTTVGATNKPIYLNAGTPTALSATLGSAALPVYLAAGSIVACTASSIFSNLSNSGNNISITVAGLNRTLTVGYATNSSNSTTSSSVYTGSISGSTQAEALKTYFNSNKASIPRNKLISFYSSAYSNGSLGFGYFLAGYDTTPYGGFFFSRYGTPSYVGITSGSFVESTILTTSNYASTLDGRYFRYLGLNINSNWNSITTTGNVRITNLSITNGPSGAYTYGQLLTFNAGGTLSLIYLPHSSALSMYIRTGWSGVSLYYGWILVLTSSNYTDYTVTKTGEGASGTWGISITGNAATATTALCLAFNSRMDYGWNGLNYFNINGTAGTAVKVNNTPTTAWWHILRFNHANSSGYYTDLAVPFNANSLYYKRVAAGALVNGKWVRILDELNYTSYVNPANFVTSLGTNGNYVTWTKNGTTNNLTVPFATTSNVLNNLGNRTAISGTTVGLSGLRLYRVYNNGYPVTFGNVLNIGGIGYGELLFLWTGDSNPGHLYYRSKRDVASQAWSNWVTILDNNNYPSTLDGRYVNISGDTMTGKLSWSMNGVTSSISSDNATFTHYRTTASSGHWFDKSIRVLGDIYAGSSYNLKVWHAGNDGSGSGLDADLLDGYHASAFSYKSWWHWSGQSGQPSWIWGGNSENNYYVYNPSNFSVNYATYSGSLSNNTSTNANTLYRNPGFAAWSVWSTFSNTPTNSYTNGINLNSSDINYGWLLAKPAYVDRPYYRGRLAGSFTSWKGIAFTSEIPTVTNYYWANIKVSASSSTSTSPTFSTAYTSNWFRSTGKTGWYSETYGGGIYMTDSTYVRTYNSKALYVSNTGDYAMYTAGGFASARTSGNILSTYYNNTWYGSIKTYGNGNLSLLAPGGNIYLAYDRGLTYFGGETYYINRSGYFNGTVAVANKLGTTTKGSATKGIYLSSGTPTAMTYSLNATVNSGTSGKLAYYSETNSIDDYASTKGSSIKPIYLNAGVPTECTYIRKNGGVKVINGVNIYHSYYLFGPIIAVYIYITGSNNLGNGVLTIATNLPKCESEHSGLTISKGGGSVIRRITFYMNGTTLYANSQNADSMDLCRAAFTYMTSA